MEQILIHPQGPKLSRIVYGVWRIIDAKLTKQEILQIVETCLELGIDWFDHADIYGNYECEQIFGEAISNNTSLKKKISIVTKSDICLISDKYPERKVKYYDTSAKHLSTSVENSLKKIGVEKIDIFLIHRPDPLMDPEKTGKCLDDLIHSGKIQFAGVSNFTPSQFKLLQSNMSNPLVTNQIEINPMRIEPFINGDLDFLMEKKISPMAWSPMAGGNLVRDLTNSSKQNTDSVQNNSLNKSSANIPNLNDILHTIARETEQTVPQTIIAWLLNHPSKIIPVIGTTKKDRILELAESMSIQMKQENWFRIYESALGTEVP
ncbi:aldo/keto reductase [Leptospira sp. GIMC2001]|uniref:aldo/keto reductase n=1 Tax=Leptospira sp. GIMC2001 TaxID=1513297 RepID=UPI00234B1D5F|nr:aldo/keto reductase [Leptospira sp. GIMC2001]WCL50925.1 aldo/keto reductase [Leptospira sp. GIMC2001]